MARNDESDLEVVVVVVVVLLLVRWEYLPRAADVMTDVLKSFDEPVRLIVSQVPRI